MSRNAISWLSVCILFGLAMLGFGVKQGINVGESNSLNKLKYEEKIKQLTPTSTPKPTMTTGYRDNIDNNCKVSYLLPENISSGEAKVDLICSRKTASQEAKLKNEGYTLVTLSSKRVWIKSVNYLTNLITRTIESLDK